MPYNTGNPVGSTDPRDLFDNAGNMDKFENGPNPFYPDRFGVQKLSRSGMIENYNNMIDGQESAFNAAQSARESEFSSFLESSGFVSLGNYTGGLEFTRYNEYMARGGFFYRPAPSSIPFTTTGTWDGADEDLFVLFSQDDALRQELAAVSGSGRVGYSISESYPSGSVGRALADRERESRFYPVERYLPNDYVIDGSVDYTAELQLAIDEQPRLSFPPFPIQVSQAGLSIPSDRVIQFTGGAKLVMPSADVGSYEILRIHDVENVALIEPVIEGDKYAHVGTAGEWGMGISIRGSNNIYVHRPVISKCWGDAIYIGQTATNLAGRNIIIEQPHCFDNRRQGISIISAIGLRISDPILEDTRTDNAGTTPLSAGPHAGIDIEPNDETAELQDIVITNVHSTNNQGVAVLIALPLFMRGIAPAARKHVTISIDGVSSEGDSAGLRLAGGLCAGVVSGSITARNVDTNNSRLNGIFATSWPADLGGLQVVVDRPSITNWGRDPVTSASPRYASPIAIYQTEGSENVGHIGGMTIVNPSIASSQPTSPGGGCGLYAESPLSGVEVRNVSLINPVKWTVPTGDKGKLYVKGGITIVDPAALITAELTGSATLNRSDLVSRNVLKTSVSPTITVTDYYQGAPDLVFAVEVAGQYIDVLPPTGGTLIDAATTNSRVRVSGLGASVTLRWVSSTSLVVVSKVGNCQMFV